MKGQLLMVVTTSVRLVGLNKVGVALSLALLLSRRGSRRGRRARYRLLLLLGRNSLVADTRQGGSELVQVMVGKVIGSGLRGARKGLSVVQSGGEWCSLRVAGTSWRTSSSKLGHKGG